MMNGFTYNYAFMPQLGYYNSQALMNSLQLIEEAVRDEKRDELFYDYLITEAPDDRQKEIIAAIRDDEMKHNMLFRQVFKNYTGRDIISDENVTFDEPVDYVTGLQQALLGELRSLENYRIIRQGLPDIVSRDILFEIITDELKHSSEFNYLFTLNQ